MSDRTPNPARDVVAKPVRRCPICNRPAAEDVRPFCSKRCGDIDLGRWLKEGYRVPTDEAPDDGEPGDGGRGPTGQER